MAHWRKSKRVFAIFPSKSSMRSKTYWAFLIMNFLNFNKRSLPERVRYSGCVPSSLRHLNNFGYFPLAVLFMDLPLCRNIPRSCYRFPFCIICLITIPSPGISIFKVMHHTEPHKKQICFTKNFLCFRITRRICRIIIYLYRLVYRALLNYYNT